MLSSQHVNIGLKPWSHLSNTAAHADSHSDLISLFSAPTVQNLKALTWKNGVRNDQNAKSVTASVCTYLMSCKAHYQYHELGALDEEYLWKWS